MSSGRKIESLVTWVGSEIESRSEKWKRYAFALQVAESIRGGLGAGNDEEQFNKALHEEWQRKGKFFSSVEGIQSRLEKSKTSESDQRVG
jgi:hypothetical protein